MSKEIELSFVAHQIIDDTTITQEELQLMGIFIPEMLVEMLQYIEQEEE